MPAFQWTVRHWRLNWSSWPKPVVPGFSARKSQERTDHKKSAKLPNILRPGDTVAVTRIDRLARSTFELFAIVKKIADAGAQFVSLAEPWADTAASTGRLMIAVLGGLVNVERDLIRTRTAEGRARAEARWQHMGRPKLLTTVQLQEAAQRSLDGEAIADLARSDGASPAVIYRATRRT